LIHSSEKYSWVIAQLILPCIWIGHLVALLTATALFQGMLLGICFCIVIAITVNTTGVSDYEILDEYSSLTAGCFLNVFSLLPF